MGIRTKFVAGMSFVKWGYPAIVFSLRGWSEVSYSQVLTNRSQNRGFLVRSQDSVDVINGLSIPVRATSGAISFITGTYRDRGGYQRIKTIHEAETGTICVPLVIELSTDGENRSPEKKTRPSFDEFFHDSRTSLTI